MNRKRCPTVWMMWWSVPSLPWLLSLDWLKSWLLTFTWTAPGSLPQYCCEQKHHMHKHPAQGADALCGWKNPVLLNCRGFICESQLMLTEAHAYSEWNSPFVQKGGMPLMRRGVMLVGVWVGLYHRRGCKFKGWCSRWYLCAVKTALFEYNLPAALLNRPTGLPTYSLWLKQ